MKTTALLFLPFLLSACQSLASTEIAESARASAAASTTQDTNMDLGTLELGNFSVSLAVKDLAKSRAFYEALGFEQKGGVAEQNWLVLQNGTTTIGLFQGMFDRNMLTFNPGWDKAAQRLEKFTDVREIQRELEKRGLTLTTRADEATQGPAHVTLVDPDGNPILIDQHVE